MRCIYCNTPLTGMIYCPGCGADVSLEKRIGRISNLLYNRALEKASVRDLSGAISCLKQSLKFNKENTDARNLLGLCYYETGEVVSALCEWVISKNLKETDNLAEYFLDCLQGDRNHLDVINQSIRKYNQSVEYCNSNHEDMAVMQLKKVVAQNPKFVRAQQLLALLYMKRQEYEKARRLLKKSAAIDNTDTTTLRYLSEIEEITGRTSAFGYRRRRSESEQEETGSTLRYISGNEMIIQPTTFRDSSTIATFINIGLGILLGGALIWFLAVPANRQTIQENANRQGTDANLKLASGTAQLQDLQDEISSYEAQIQAANQERDDALNKVKSYDELLTAASQYVSGDQVNAVEALGSIREEDLEGSAKTLFDNMKGGVSDVLFNQYYTAGTTAYAGQNYTQAAEQLKLAVETDAEGTQANYFNALYYLGFAYYNLRDYTQADEVFNTIVEKFPSRAYEVQPYIGQGGSSGGSASGSSAGAGSSSQGEASMNQDSITVYGQDSYNSSDYSGNGSTYQAYDPSQVAWTDPYTGLHYDAYGNLLG